MEGGRDLAMSDYFKTLREPLIAQQKKTDEKQDELIERLKDNQERIMQAIEYNPQRALTYEGGHYPNLTKDDEEEEDLDTGHEEYESSKEETNTSKTAEKN